MVVLPFLTNYSFHNPGCLQDSALAMMNIRTAAPLFVEHCICEHTLTLRNSFNQQIQHIMHVCQLSAGTSEACLQSDMVFTEVLLLCCCRASRLILIGSMSATFSSSCGA